MNSESPIDTAFFSSQEIAWASDQLALVDRKATPWSIVHFHRPVRQPAERLTARNDYLSHPLKFLFASISLSLFHRTSYWFSFLLHFIALQSVVLIWLIV
jgi:hypothetical protein